MLSKFFTYWELGLAMGQIQRALSLDFVRAQSLCLLSRLCHLGEGAQAAVARRQQAHYQAHIRGRGVIRAGEMFAA